MSKNKIFKINGIEFSPNPLIHSVGKKKPGVLGYANDYEMIFTNIDKGIWREKECYRELIKTDLFFLVYFIFGIKEANHPFVVQACQDVERGAKSMTLDIWGREHYKSVIITRGETIQKILRNPEERVGIFSHTRAAAKSFFRSIKLTLEGSNFLKTCFDDILYEKPSAQAPKWSEDDGLVVKRKGFFNESTIEACGLIEGMPTGKHFSHRVYDDITTIDLVKSPEQMARLEEAFDMSDNLGTVDGTHRVIGTPYSHLDCLAYLKNKRDSSGNFVYNLRMKPSLEGGVIDGKPVLLSEERISVLKMKPAMFRTQHLLDPTPEGSRELNSSFFNIIDHDKIPRQLHKIMTVDPAGSEKKKKGDAWAIELFGVGLEKDSSGQRDIYLLDAIIASMGQSEAMDAIVRMYLSGGVIDKLGVEKVALSTTELHIASALEAFGRRLSVDRGNLIILKPSGRKKTDRIVEALEFPLNQGKLYLSSKIPAVYIDRLKKEADLFPHWHDDGLDAFSYVYDIIKVSNIRNPVNTLRVREKISQRITYSDREAGY